MGKKIFIIEDDIYIRMNLKMLLESEGYSIETASDGKDALERLKAATSLPSLILLDLMMPIMDGFQFRHEQERDPRLADIPVVIISAGGNIEPSKIKIGAKASLKKPFNIEDVLDTIKQFANY